jgi:hypothetical protein
MLKTYGAFALGENGEEPRRSRRAWRIKNGKIRAELAHFCLQHLTL